MLALWLDFFAFFRSVSALKIKIPPESRSLLVEVCYLININFLAKNIF